MSAGRKQRRSRPQEPATSAPDGGTSLARRAAMRVSDWVVRPQPIVRLELLRILVPLSILAFMSSRIAHTDEWLSNAGFTVPDLGSADWRQPVFIPPLPQWASWLVAGAMIVSGAFLAAGLATRIAAAAFALLLAYVALADRLAAFTVSKLGPVLVTALFLSPCGARYSVDAWLARKRRRSVPRPELAGGGSVRFFQVFLPVFYFSSGICKARGDWLDHPLVLWTQLHGSYQTAVTHFLANALPAWSWTVLQGLTLAFELLAPLWFAIARIRPVALAYGILMHVMIGLMFGPVLWFSLLMISLLVASYAPERWLSALLDRS